MHGDKTKQKLHALGTCDSNDDSNTIAVVVVRFVVDKSNSKSKLKCRVEGKRGIDRKREPVIGKC